MKKFQHSLFLLAVISVYIVLVVFTLFMRDFHTYSMETINQIINILLFGETIALISVISFYFLLIRYSREVEKKVALRTDELNNTNRKLKQLSLTDALTNIANRRRFNQVLKMEWHRAIRNKNSLTLIMMDIDFFKAFNDHYGHLAGDDCLVDVANALAGVTSRPGDLLARYGGEEFALILPETGVSSVRVAEMCREAVESAAIPHKFSKAAEMVTISVGLACFNPVPDNVHYEELIKASDNALYKAKDEGRNRVVHANKNCIDL